MRRNTGGDMQVNVAGLRRNLKNLAHNYSDSQRKVREATSNDPWGPSSTLMAEIADLTYNVVAFTEIMQMVWKRLNDHGRNWRHVYKALVLLEYLIKTGSEKVGQQCKENIYAIQTLKDFQYLEEGKDQGQNVREKAKQLVNLLKDDERLRNERARALKAKERFAQSASGFGSDGGLETPTSPKYPAFAGNEWNSSRDSDEVAVELPRDLEVARPQTAGEEELQLQLALAMSREEAEQEEQKRRSDDVRLQLALSQSQQDFKVPTEKQPSAMLDLLDVSLDDPSGKVVDPWGMPQPPKPQQTTGNSPWHNTGSPPADPWAPVSATPPLMPPQPMKSDPWITSRSTNMIGHGMTPTPLVETAIRNDPWSPVSHSSSDLDDFDAITNRNRSPNPTTNGGLLGTNGNNNTSDPFELNLLGDLLPPSSGPSPSTGATKKTPHSFLGENSALVNLDNLVTSESLSKPTNHQVNTVNPFSDPNGGGGGGGHPSSRPIFNPQPPKPTMNQIKQAPFMASPQMGNTPPSYNNAPFSTSPATNFTNNGQFNSNGGGVGGGYGSAPPIQDPWAPPPQNNTSSQLGAPWMKPGYTF